MKIDQQQEFSPITDTTTTTSPSAAEHEPAVHGVTPQEYLDKLRTVGRKTLIDFSLNDELLAPPAWLDEARFKRARKILLQYKLGVEFSSLTGLYLILQIPDGLEPLLTTGLSKDIPNLFNRYLNTILHVRNWYDYDIFEQGSKGNKSIRTVRGMHKRLQNLMNQKFSVPNYEGQDEMWMTQYEVTKTQFSFIGLALLYPQKCGIGVASKEELKEISYYWRVLGYMMGVQDEYNCCGFEDFDDTLKCFQLIMDQEVRPRLEKEPCPVGLAMCQAISIALADFIPTVTFNSLSHWWADEFMFNGYEPQPMTMREKFLTSLGKLSFDKLFKYKPILRSATKLQEMRFNRLVKKRDQIHKKLKDKYANDEKYQFYSDRVDYLGSKKSTSGPKNDDSDEATKCDEINDEISNLDVAGCPFGYGSKAAKLGPSIEQKLNPKPSLDEHPATPKAIEVS